MRYHVLTLFPEMVLQGLHTSIIGRAVERGVIAVEAVNIRDYADNDYGKVDDYPYGGGAGMVMQAEPVYRAYEAVAARLPKKPRVLHMTPQGRVFTQQMAAEFAREEDLVFLCGHYEGIDERVLEEIVTDNVSIGDYVLTGGNRRSTIPSRTACWNIPSTAAQKSGGAGRFRKFCCPGTMPMWKNGGMSSLFCAPGSEGRICWKKIYHKNIM